LAFSPAYVQAGALLSLHVNPAQLGRQTGMIVSAALQGKALPATPIYSQDFSVAVNEPVARSLGFRLDGEALRRQIRDQEGLP
jgi:ABC-type uncharacterized transport system substrate-binding protein